MSESFISSLQSWSAAFESSNSYKIWRLSYFDYRTLIYHQNSDFVKLISSPPFWVFSVLFLSSDPKSCGDALLEYQLLHQCVFMLRVTFSWTSASGCSEFHSDVHPSATCQFRHRGGWTGSATNSLLLLDLHGEPFHVGVFKVKAEVLSAEAQLSWKVVSRKAGRLEGKKCVPCEHLVRKTLSEDKDKQEKLTKKYKPKNSDFSFYKSNTSICLILVLEQTSGIYWKHFTF